MPLHPRIKPGEFADSLRAADLNRRSEQIEELANLRVGGSLTQTSSTIARPVERGFWAKLSGSVNPYGFVEVVEDGKGNWLTVPGGLSGQGTTAAGDLQAFEVNHVANLNGKVIQLWPGAPGDYRGQIVQGGGFNYGSPVYVSPPNCFCLVPTTLSMVSANPACDYGIFQSSSLVWGPQPADVPPYNFPSKAHWSPSKFVDQANPQYPYYYLFLCYQNKFTLTRVYPHSPYGDPYQDAILYTWFVGQQGNTCPSSTTNPTPFKLISGSPYAGSDTTCSVSVTQ